jgi:hypothetical protein
VSDIFQEVEEELRAERARSVLRRYGGWFGLAAVLVILGTGAYEFWSWRWEKYQSRIATRYLDGIEAMAAKPRDTARARADFTDVIKKGSGAYAALATLQLAALEADQGHAREAIALWDGLAARPGVDPLLAKLAALLSVSHQLDDGDPASLAARLGELRKPDDPYRPLAEEAAALLALRQGKKDEAKKILADLGNDFTAPPGLRQRAAALSVEIGE